MSDPSNNEPVTDPDNADIDELPGEFTPPGKDGAGSLQDGIDALLGEDEDPDPAAPKT